MNVDFIILTGGSPMSTSDVQALPADDFDLESTTTEIAVKLQNSPEITALKNQINILQAESVMQFGQDTAKGISSFADQILSSIKSVNVEDSGSLLKQLNKIMDKFNISDFSEKEDEPGFFEKLFGGGKRTIDSLLGKYESMGSEVDAVYIQLKKYEQEISRTNGTLEEMFKKNVDYYEQLEKYILAGKNAAEEIRTVMIPDLESKAAASQDQLEFIKLDNVKSALDFLEQRVFDLELAKNVALQSMPQIKMIQRGNFHLVRKINSAFIVTIPIFKQGITQAIALKRQAVQAEALAALDEKTNELLLKNAQNTATQSKLTAQLSTNSSIKTETLEEAWKTIVQGIEETQAIENQARAAREDGSKRIEQLQNEFQQRFQKKIPQ